MPSNRLLVRFLAGAWLMCASTGIGTAQDLVGNAAMTGLGNSAGAMTRGIDALGVNPALITLQPPVRFSFSILPAGFQVGTDFISWGTYKKYFTGKVNAEGRRVGYHMTDADKQEVLDQFSSDDGKFGIDARCVLLAAAWRSQDLTFAFDVRERVAATGVIPKRFVEFLFNGNPPGERFDFSNLDVQTSWTRDYAITLAYMLPHRRGSASVSLGISAKYIQGFGHFSIDHCGSWFYTDSDSFVVSGRADMLAHSSGTNWIEDGNSLFSLFPHTVGQGFGLDAGVHIAFDQSFSIGLSLLDIGYIRWDDDVRQYLAAEDFAISDISTADQLDDLKRRLDGFDSPSGSYTSYLPMCAVLSGAYVLDNTFGRNRPLALTAAVRMGFNNEAGNSTSPRAGVGAEARFIPSVPLRLGLILGSMETVTLTCGAGFRSASFSMDIATGNLLTLLTDGVSSASYALSWHVDI
jgi:hypothetical protein